MSALLDLADRMSNLMPKLEAAANKRKQKAALAMIEFLPKETPVDTSNALSNWQVTLSTPISVQISPHVLGYKGSTRGASVGITVALARQIIAASKPGQSIWIQNNAPYIKDLEGGSSLQNRGFYAAALLLGRITINGTKLNV